MNQSCARFFLAYELEYKSVRWPVSIKTLATETITPVSDEDIKDYNEAIKSSSTLSRTLRLPSGG